MTPEQQEALAALTALRPGWDNNAKAITPQAIDAAGAFLDQIIWQGVPDPQILPLPTGGVALHWSCNGWAIEVWFCADGQGLASVEWDGGLPEHQELLFGMLRSLAQP